MAIIDFLRVWYKQEIDDGQMLLPQFDVEIFPIDFLRFKRQKHLDLDIIIKSELR